MYRPSTSPYQFPTTMQSWSQGSSARIVGSSLISSSNSKSAGSACRVYNFLKTTKGNNFAIQFFKNASFGPYMINKRGNGLIWN